MYNWNNGRDRGTQLPKGKGGPLMEVLKTMIVIAIFLISPFFIVKGLLKSKIAKKEAGIKPRCNAKEASLYNAFRTQRCGSKYDMLAWLVVMIGIIVLRVL